MRLLFAESDEIIGSIEQDVFNKLKESYPNHFKNKRIELDKRYERYTNQLKIRRERKGKKWFKKIYKN